LIKLIRTLFNHRRKIISNTLKNYPDIEKDSEKNKTMLFQYLNKRPEELVLENFKEIYSLIHN